ncbi:MAG: LacI family DNA-binding transcriptional regulator [Chloroflexota bacterium]
MAVTIKDIARVANVSHSTVSRALGGHPGIPVETAERIRGIALELGYIPSAVARGLKTSRSQVLGVIVSRIDDPFFSEILQGIEDVFQEAGYSLFVAASNRDLSREKEIARTMLEHRVDGLIICTTQFGEEHYRLLKQYGLPIVTVGNHELTDYQYMVCHDDFYGSCQVTSHLIGLGHERIAFLGNARAELTTQGRLNGFFHEMQAANLPVLDRYVYHSVEEQLEGGAEGARYLMNLPDLPSAIMCFNDMMAIGAIKVLRDAGIQVPGVCSVTGFDDIPFAAYANPPLTTFEQPKYQLGHEAARMMSALLRSEADMEADSGQTLILRGGLVVRETTAPQ